MRKVSALFFVLSILSTPLAKATDGSSGCGPAWYVSSQNTLLSSAVRFVVNWVTFPISTIGMTVGTSNCTKHELVLNEKQSLHFVTMAYYELKGDIARGEGSYLAALSETMGCPTEATPDLRTQLKQNFKQIYPNSQTNPEQTLLEVFKTIVRDERLTRLCALHLS